MCVCSGERIINREKKTDRTHTQARTHQTLRIQEHHQTNNSQTKHTKTHTHTTIKHQHQHTDEETNTQETTQTQTERRNNQPVRDRKPGNHEVCMRVFVCACNGWSCRSAGMRNERNKVCRSAGMRNERNKVYHAMV